MSDPRDDPPRGDAEPAPSARKGGSADAFAARQRERLIGAVATCMARHGYAELTVAHIVTSAGVSRPVFYEYFANKLEAVLAAHDAVFEPFYATITEVCGLPRAWPAKVTLAIGHALEYASDQPDRAQLLTVEAITQNAALASKVLESSNRLAELLSSGRQLSPAASSLPALTEKAVVGGISAIVNTHLVSGESERLLELKRELTEITLLPFLGPEQAAQIAKEQA
jgi:AcrR family transcriptional regulator